MYINHQEITNPPTPPGGESLNKCGLHFLFHTDLLPSGPASPCFDLETTTPSPDTTLDVVLVENLLDSNKTKFLSRGLS